MFIGKDVNEDNIEYSINLKSEFIVMKVYFYFAKWYLFSTLLVTICACNKIIAKTNDWYVLICLIWVIFKINKN